MAVAITQTEADPEFINRLLAIISKEGLVPAEKLSFDAALDTLGVQSADVVAILLAIEDEYGVYIPVDSELSETKTVGDLVHALARHIAANSQSP